MPQGPFTRIVIRRPNGAVDVIGRMGHVPVDAVGLMVAQMRAGTVVAVRHEQMPTEGGAVRTIAIHDLELRTR